MLKNLSEYLFSLPQYGLPHHFLSRLMHSAARCENPIWKNALIKTIVGLYGIDLKQAQEPDPKAYASFNAFFTRALKPEVRPLCAENGALLCPADGTISQIGTVSEGGILQAKGHYYSTIDLLGGDIERAKPFVNGKFATVYLSPRDYHRLHMPLTGSLHQMVHVPGRLFSVNAATTNTVPNLFARNERVVAIFASEAGPMALVLVGAIFVASIETVWHGEVTPPTGDEVRVWSYQKKPLVLSKGAEMGRFNMGSTIVMLFGDNAVAWDDALQVGDKVLMGQKLGQLC